MASNLTAIDCVCLLSRCPSLPALKASAPNGCDFHLATLWPSQSRQMPQRRNAWKRGAVANATVCTESPVLSGCRWVTQSRCSFLRSTTAVGCFSLNFRSSVCVCVCQLLSQRGCTDLQGVQAVVSWPWTNEDGLTTGEARRGAFSCTCNFNTP